MCRTHRLKYLFDDRYSLPVPKVAKEKELPTSFSEYLCVLMPMQSSENQPRFRFAHVYAARNRV